MNKIVALLLLVVISCQGPSSSKESATNEDNSSSTLALSTLSGESIDLENYADKLIILNIWATWCKPCIAEMPDLAEMQNELPEGFQLLLASDEPLERQLKFIERQSFDLVFVQLTSSLEGLGVYALPTTLIIDSKGNILDTMVGARAWNTPEQIEKITSYSK